MLAVDALIGRLAVALGIGLVIGLERERRKGSGPSRGPAGVRTFALNSATIAAEVRLRFQLVTAAVEGMGE